ncbi:MAG: Uma2 family endonuclease [Acetobacteraceae bacterium]
MTVGEFLAWESRQDLKFEFDGFQPVAMTGGIAAHAAIQRNLIALLYGHLRGGPCQVFGRDLKIQAAGSIRYPDAFVVCSPVSATDLVITDPIVVFEILSPGTSATNRIEKNREYRLTPSIQRYVILEQTRPAATIFSRAGDNWLADVAVGDADLSLPEIGVKLNLAELYAGVPLAAGGTA